MGLRPDDAKVYAANNPAGPLPTIIGRIQAGDDDIIEGDEEEEEGEEERSDIFDASDAILEVAGAERG